MHAGISWWYFLRRISDCSDKLFPGHGTAAESNGFIHAAPASSACPADTDTASLFGLDGILYAGPAADVGSAL